MAWNEPGDQNNDKNPWTGKDKKPANPSHQELSDFLKKLQERIEKKVHKNKPPGNGGPGGTDSSSGNFGFAGVVIFLVALIAMWALSGIFIVDPAERSVVLVLGKYDRTMGPGVHWLPRFFASEERINVQQIYSLVYPASTDAMMLTRDENIVDVAVTVKYMINNPLQYLYSVVDPVESLNQATASALRQVIGNNRFDTIITTGRDQVRAQVQQQLTEIISRYNLGIQIVDVTLKSAKAPEQVKDAFDDAIKAREDEQRYINQAETYQMQVVPIANGQAAREMEVAKAYAKQVVLQAQANTASFVALLPEYEKAPAIMRERIYLDAMQQILAKNSKYVLNGNNQNLLYLPSPTLTAAEAAKTVPAPTPVLTNTSSNVPAEKASNPNSGVSSRPARNQTDNGYGQGGPYE